MSQAQLDEKDAKIAILQRALAERASELAPKEFMKRMGEGLKCQFQKLGDELRKTQELLAAAASRATRAEQEVERLGESSKTLERELEKSRIRITSLESSERERDTLREKSAKLSLVVDRLRESEQALKTERAQLLQEKNNMGTAYAEERTTLEEKCAQLEREKTTLETARAQMARENANLKAENARLTENNTTLEAEQARLLQEKATAESTIAELRAEKQNAELRAGRAATYLEMHAQTHAVFEDMRQTILQQRERIAAYETQEEAFKEATARVEEMRTQMDALVDREVQASQRYADLEQEKVKADAELNSVLAREAQLLEQVEALEKGQVRMRELEDDLERAKAQIVALEAHAKQTSDSAQQMLHDARENFNRTLQAKDDVWNAKDEELRRAQEQARAAVQQCQQLAMQLQAASTQLAQAQTLILSLQTQVQNAGPTYQEVLALRAQVTNLQNQVQQFGQMLNNRDARVASLEIQLQQAQDSKARRSQDAQTEPILVLRVSKQELEAREGKKDGSVQAKLEDNTMALVKRSTTEEEIAALVAERDDLLQQVKGQDDLQKSLLDQVEAANRTNAVLRSELSRLHEIRYTTGAVLAAKPGDASTPTVAKPTLGPSNAANAQPEAGPSTIRPAKSLSPGSKENALPRTQAQSHHTAHAVAPPSSSVVSEPVFGRVVQQNLRSQTWPTSGHMWLNIMVCPMEGGSVPLRVLLEAFVRDSGSAVDAAEFGALVRQWGDRMFAGRMQLVGDALRGVAMNEGTTAKTALVPATPRAPLPAAAPRSLPTPATAPRPPAPAGPRLPPPARPAAPRLPPPPAQVKAEPDIARAAPAKRRTAEGPTGEERPVKRARSGSPSAASSSEAPASSPTRRIASSSRELASLPLTRRAPAAAPAAVKVSTAARSATTEAELPTKHKPKPKPAQAQAGPSSQPAHAPVNARSSSSSQRAESSSSQRAGSSSSQRPGTSSSSRQEPARVDPEHTHDVAWDIEESGMEDLFVLWLRQGILRDISSTVSRSVAVQRATETLRRRGWVAEDGSFVVPKTSSEYRYARFGQLTISTALGFFDF